jgi:hypothetical protein
LISDQKPRLSPGLLPSSAELRIPSGGRFVERRLFLQAHSALKHEFFAMQQNVINNTIKFVLTS